MKTGVAKLNASQEAYKQKTDTYENKLAEFNEEGNGRITILPKIEERTSPD